MTNQTTEPGHSGPFATEKDARESWRNVVSQATYEASITEGNRARLALAIKLAGVVLGSYDKQIMDWLAGWEIATVTVVAGVIDRASDRVPPAYTATVHDAFYDAIRFRQARLAQPCADCDEAKKDPERRELSFGLCVQHCDDRDAIGLYRTAAEKLVSTWEPR